jgi:hypothetical protein
MSIGFLVRPGQPLIWRGPMLHSAIRQFLEDVRWGELDYLGREQMVPEFARAAFSLKPGELSGVVKTPFGYHVLRLVDRKKGQPATFDQVRGQLQRRLLDEKQSQRFQAWIKELEGAAKVTRDEGLLPVGRLAPALPQAPPGPAGGSAKPGDKS